MINDRVGRTKMLYICVRCLCVQDRASMSNTKCKHTDKFVPACKNCMCKVFLDRASNVVASN